MSKQRDAKQFQVRLLVLVAANKVEITPTTHVQRCQKLGRVYIYSSSCLSVVNELNCEI